MRSARRLIATGAVCVLLVWPASASGGTRVVFTIDVESNDRLRLPDQIDAVCEGGVPCGVMEIVRGLADRKWPGTFFFNVYEHAQWGETAMRNIAVRLQDAGHDLALHTHAQWVYDSSRWAMHQYTLDEQTTIVRDGVRLLTAWTGRPVVAHRAGAYTADERTLIALERNGVLIDSSLLWQHPNSRLDTLGLPRNLPSRHGRVAEIPVTVYERADRPRIVGAALGSVTAIRKIDPNWFVDADEARMAIASVLAADVPVLVVFLHSYSFMTAQTGGGPPLADRHGIEMFRVIVEEVARRDLPVVTMRELADGLAALPSSGKDVVPAVTVRVDLSRYLWRRVKAADGLSLSVGAALMLACVGGALVLALRRRAADKGMGQQRPASRAWTGAGSR